MPAGNAVGTWAGVDCEPGARVGTADGETVGVRREGTVGVPAQSEPGTARDDRAPGVAVGGSLGTGVAARLRVGATVGGSLGTGVAAPRRPVDG
ncbi:MAG TPA: hypothetical protein VFH76_15900, partial [Kribbella sp.]|nr:hypothetical protein [Kribbella sp.]